MAMQHDKHSQDPCDELTLDALQLYVDNMLEQGYFARAENGYRDWIHRINSHPRFAGRKPRAEVVLKQIQIRMESGVYP